jgi:hypothetical protein
MALSQFGAYNMSTTYCKIALLVLFATALEPMMQQYWHCIAVTMTLSWYDASNIILLTNSIVLFGHAEMPIFHEY